LIDQGLILSLEIILRQTEYQGDSKDVVSRTINLLAKLCRVPKGAENACFSVAIIEKTLKYFSKEYPDLIQNSLRVFHALCKQENFRSLYETKHALSLSKVDPYIKEVKDLFKEGVAAENWDQVINTCGSVSAFVDSFPEKKADFSDIIVPLIKIMSEKVDSVRKMAAICMAKLTKEEGNEKIMKENHGLEVLVSLGGALAN